MGKLARTLGKLRLKQFLGLQGLAFRYNDADAFCLFVGQLSVHFMPCCRVEPLTNKEDNRNCIDYTATLAVLLLSLSIGQYVVMKDTAVCE